MNAHWVLVLATDLLMPITVFSVGATLLRARDQGPNAIAIYFTLALVTLWAAAWSWFPALATLRFLPAPSGQAGAIAALIIVLNLTRFIPSISAMFQSIDIKRLIDLGVWRVVYGAAILVIGLLGGLPREFFWSAAFGDIFVGLWALSLIQRRPMISTKEIVTWNLLGALDLVHVLALGAVYLRAFYVANPSAVPLNLLPLAGVPLLLTIHIQTLIVLIKRRASTRVSQ
jgi:hypothetical protein